MGELYNPFPRLPKNIRQIGDRDDVVKLYVEDYVNTYLKRLYPTGGQDLSWNYTRQHGNLRRGALHFY